MRIRFDPRRGGFTLMELLLTLAIFAALASVAVPQFAALISDRGLVRGADQVKIAMIRLRVEAMREGRVMIMQGDSESGGVSIRPYFSVNDSTETADPSGSQVALLNGADQATVTAAPTAEVPERQIDLPEGVRFGESRVSSTVRSMAVELALQATSGAATNRPVLFYPDGTTSTARVTLSHPEIGSIHIDLRGVTGDVTVSEINVDTDLIGGGQ